MTRKATDRGDLIAVLAAFSLFLSTVDFIVSAPLPFIRLGLANLAFLVGLRILRPRDLFALIAVKVIAQGIIFGTIFSVATAYSVAGSLAGGLAMLAASRLLGKRVTLVGVSVCGAFASNVAQIAVAGLPFILGSGVWLMAPPLLLAGTVTSLILGLLAERFAAKSVWVKKNAIESGVNIDAKTAAANAKRKKKKTAMKKARRTA